ncbi:hypothetical protein C1886_19180 [Pseudomonas sp. FW300-N1A1]|uniref:phosphatidylinositol-specific phospholipase C domain-containing protein n=1 Tax=Pseudomonas sp. FW300-N1A1 TaxID=2075555 RepID=UPI000CD03B65|nr:phosphatidylinositol-specific phospholipase C domain-containing protein [Pseudomonas sp. FW300-N1A1]POA17970.1 hypothetical protein C1886_19180 [Pseudomonas sp. FW300-N1A1]
MSIQEYCQGPEAELQDTFLLPPTVSDTENDVLNYNSLTTNPVVGVSPWLGINSESRIWLHCECTYTDEGPGIIKLAEAVRVGTPTGALAFSCELPLDELSKLADNTSIDIVLMVSTNGTLEKQHLNSTRHSLMFQHPIVLTNYSRWMTDIGSNIEHLQVHDLILPEAHNAGVDQKGAGWPTDQWGACQDDTFTYQLRNGIRALDLRLYRNPNEMYTDKEYIFKHGRFHSRRYLNDCLHAVLEFVEQNPGEIVILDFHSTELDWRENNVVSTIEIVLGKHCIPGSAELYTIGRIRKQHPGRNVIVGFRNPSWLCWGRLHQTFTGNDYNNAQQLRLHIIEQMDNPPKTNELWSIFAAGYNSLGPVRFSPRAAHWSSFFDATRSSSYRKPTKGNLINIDFFAGTGVVDRCINATRERANKASTSPPTRLTASNITTHSIHLKWERPVDNEAIRDYRILEDGKIISNTPGTEYVVSGLNDGTTYNFEVYAFFTAESGFGAAAFISATTIGIPDTTKPSKPTDLKLVYLNDNNLALLRWTAATDNIAVTHYVIYRNGTPVDTLSSEHTFYPVNETGIVTYRVRAFDAAGNFADSDPLTNNPDTLPPSKPGNLRADDIKFDSITLEWEPSTDNVRVTGYQVYRNDIAIDTVNSTFYIDRLLIANTHYSYKVRALDAAGNFTDSDTLRIITLPDTPDTTAPTKPTNLRATHITDSTVTLEWTASSDNIGVSHYEILRDNTPINITTNTGYTDRGLSLDRAYVFRVRAVDAAGNFSLSDPITVRTSDQDMTPPSVPGNLRASIITNNSVTLEWNPSYDNVWVSGYEVRNGGALLGTVLDTRYNVVGLSSNTNYTLSVVALDAAENRSDSTVIWVTTSPESNAPTELKLFRQPSSGNYSWKPPINSIGVTGYQVSLDGEILREINDTFITLFNLKPGVIHLFEVRARRNGVPSDPASISG